MKTDIVLFAGDEIILFHDKVVVASIAKSIGLNVDSAVRGINNHKILGAVATVESVQVANNQARNYLTLPIEYVGGWLFSINIDKVNDSIKQKLELYQRECFKILNDHFFGKYKNISDSQRELAYIRAKVSENEKQMKELVKQTKMLLKRKNEIEVYNFTQLEINYHDSKLFEEYSV